MRGRSFFHFALDPRKEIHCLHRWDEMTLPNHVDCILNSLNRRAELTMGRLESALQDLHERGKPIEITWLWDGGVDVKAGDEMRNFRSVEEVLPWLQHWYSLKPKPQKGDALETELQKIYDSEINITLRIGGKRIFVALGNDFTGFEPERNLTSMADVLPWIQKSIHKHYPMSKYDVERLGGTFTSEMAEIPQ